MKRNAAHGGALLLPAIPAGQHKIQLLGGDFGVVKKHFVEIAQAKEQQHIGIFAFYIKILFHHRRKPVLLFACHIHPPYI